MALSLYKDAKEFVLIGTPYNSKKRGIARISSGKVLIDDSSDSDKTWFVVRMELKAGGKTRHLYVWKIQILIIYRILMKQIYQ